jgi:hypothetical protein
MIGLLYQQIPIRLRVLLQSRTKVTLCHFNHEAQTLHYFESHPIRVVTLLGLREIIRIRLATERIAKWALELIGLDIAYAPQTVIKSQTQADFVAKWTVTQ